uniref:Si:dkey-117n7.3 n=1 Tax=Seriola lalandi dorsalis TaxID=1841481 RepID=A0A3B4YIW1_SERLL
GNKGRHKRQRHRLDEEEGEEFYNSEE